MPAFGAGDPGSNPDGTTTNHSVSDDPDILSEITDRANAASVNKNQNKSDTVE